MSFSPNDPKLPRKTSYSFPNTSNSPFPNFPFSSAAKIETYFSDHTPFRTSGGHARPPPMDSVISSALEEICLRGEAGVSLPMLLSTLEPSLAASNLDLSPALKQALWTGLLGVPALRLRGRNAIFSPSDPAVQSFEAAESLNVKVVADERLRDNFLGLYNAHSANAGIPLPQRRALERLAVARKDGITQSQLAKEFGVEGKALFYVLKSLECQGLIERQSAVVKTKDASEEGESRNSASVTTNLVYLSRYAKHLGSQQKFVITKEEQATECLYSVKGSAVSGDGLGGKNLKEDVLVKDYHPAMKAVCDLLENAKGKVLVVSDIKKELGYIGDRSGHREWRQVCARLVDAEYVEEFEAIVNEKVSSKRKKVKEKALRLLKTFSSESLGFVDDFGDGKIKFGKQCQISDQLIELPIEHQIYDMIDAAGSEGLTVMEVCKRLGIDNKKNHNRLVSMFSRFGMDLQAENHKKGVVYRVWTPGQQNPESANPFSNKPHLANDYRISTGNFDALDAQATNHSEFDSSNVTGDVATPEKMKNSEIDTTISSESPKDTESNLLSSNSQVMLLESRDTFSEGGLDLVSVEMGKNVVPLETPPVALKPFTSGSHQRRPSLTVDSVRREKMILERLQNEKFILIAELHKWLDSLEKDKSTTTDRKTIERLLNKLQEQKLCQCMVINVPVVTRCGRSRPLHVVLDRSVSVQSLTPELVSEIYDQMRSFEIQSRGQNSSQSKNNDPVPVLKDVERTKSHVNSDAQAVRSEAMRANGFILAKMVRAKLLHGFLWENLYGSEDFDNPSSHEKLIFDLSNPHSSSKWFSLEAAIKAIPVELFLQVAGSTQSFDSMIEKCKRRLCLSDLPVEEYKSLMDAHATRRLSIVVDILRRLKLLRMVSDECAKDGSHLLRATFTHAMELKPYIEEPISKEGISLSFRPFDLRPRIRHDFVLSSRKAVDEYWQTLEYCFAAADPRAALHAFPGSVVHEVFLFRSWASARVMTADQRAELLKRVVKDNQSGKLSFKDCGKIAKELNLSLEQVLRVYYDKRQSRLNKLPGEGEDFQTLRSNRLSSLQKRDGSPEMRSVKFRKVEDVTGLLVKQSCGTLPETKEPFREGELLVSPEKQEMDSHAFLEVDHLENEGDPVPNEDDGDHCAVISRSALSRVKPARERRFLWTEEADRQLVIQYVRYRVALGPNYHRIDWTSIPNLPAPRSTCRRRMSSLNSNVRFRKAVMRLCNILSTRYVKFLEKMGNRLLDKDDCKLQDSLGEGISTDTNSHDSNKHTRDAVSEEEAWDDFDNNGIKIALDEVLRCKWTAKLEASKKVGSTYEEWSDLNMDAEEHGLQESEVATTAAPAGDVQNVDGRKQKISVRRSRAQRLHKKFINLLNEELKVSRKVYKSVAISNAVELFKLIFLSTCTARAVPNRLAKILRHYSEHDLFAAFNYLREKRFMVGGNGNQPFSLSQQFMHNLSKSPFPSNSGTRAVKFANWLHERERDLTGGGVNLSDDLQCADVFHLFTLVSLGQISLSPCLPDEGVGEAEDARGLKRKIDTDESPDGDKVKKLKSLVAAEGEIISRREKGFPGIMLSIHRTGFSTADIVDLFRDTCNDEQHIDGKDKSDTTLGPNNFSLLDHVNEMQNSGCNITAVENSSESPWMAMASYAACLLPICSNQVKSILIDPEVFRVVYAAVRKAGDQGLSMEEVSQVINMPGEKMPELIISVLQTFGRVLKVNAFDSVHVVDALYRSKYCLTSAADTCQDLKTPSCAETTEGDDSLGFNDSGGPHARGKTDVNDDDVHKVSVLNLPEEVTESLIENQTSNVLEDCLQGKLVLPGGDKSDESLFSSTDFCVPILPWINGDGVVNEAVYKGLRRRVLGIVMQNPGILEDEIINQMDVLNPQSCRKLLETMILDKHLVVKKMHQTTSNTPPTILGAIFKSSFSKPKLVCREHFFANPLSTSLL